MKRHLVLSLAGVALLSVATSCMDDNYDLSDIDTTSKLQVDNLTIPVNIDQITLKAIFDIDENDPDAAIQVVNGEYAVVRRGDFGSSDIKINEINLHGTTGTPTQTTISTGVTGTLPAGQEVSLPFTLDAETFEYASTDVPAEIREIESLTGAFDMILKLEIPELAGVMKTITLRNLVFSLPKGFIGTPTDGTFDSEKGIITVPEAKMTNGSYTLTLACTGIDYVKAGGLFNPDTHYGVLDGAVKVESGTIVLNGSDVIGTLPADFNVNYSMSLSDIIVTAFTGKMCYEITGVDFNEVNLNDLPDFLSQEGTRITLKNPQIYLGVTNPLSVYGLQARTGMSITSEFSDESGTPSRTTSIDAPGYFDVSSAPASAYVLSPVAPANVSEDYVGAHHVPYTGLSTVLEGNGLPKRLSITLDNPNVFEQRVQNLPLGISLGDVAGSYQFLAPLTFNAGSQIVYSETEDGWNDEDVDAITIEVLQVKTTVSSTLPFSLKLTGYPIDIDGNRINNVTIEGADIPAKADKMDVTIKITGEVTHLDGIVFTATGYVPEDMKNALLPTQGITCADIRATVSGYYIKEL